MDGSQALGYPIRAGGAADRSHVAIKALSPAVNDPTTAVQSIDRIEDLLRYAAVKRLSEGIGTDRHGATRLVYRTPAWDDLVAVALDEIRAFGSGQYQVVRRLRALLESLMADLPEKRHPPLVQQRRLLDDAIASSIPESQPPRCVRIATIQHGHHETEHIFD